MSEKAPRIPKVGEFAGDYWSGFINRFEMIASRCEWTEAEKVDTFAFALVKEAAQYFSQLSQDKINNFSWVKMKFSQRFEKKDPPQTVRWELYNSCQYEDEDLDGWAARVQRMVDVAFVNAPEGTREEVAIDRFLAGCKEHGAAISVMERSPNTMDEAYEFVKKAVFVRKAMSGHRGNSGRVRIVRTEPCDKMVSSSGNEDHLGDYKPSKIQTVTQSERMSSDLNNSSGNSYGTKKQSITGSLDHKVLQMEETLQTVVKTLNSLNRMNLNSDGRSPNWRPNVCFNCGDPSHFARNCPRPYNPASPFRPRSPRVNWRISSPSRMGNSPRRYESGRESPAEKDMNWRQRNDYERGSGQQDEGRNYSPAGRDMNWRQRNDYGRGNGQQEEGRNYSRNSLQQDEGRNYSRNSNPLGSQGNPQDYGQYGAERLPSPQQKPNLN